ncbi:hypothetical protein L810_5506 [Burkholderia sp. AU4i]|nr:hypothetical protein L810_5506 [Burkholderia sp. AU4i]
MPTAAGCAAGADAFDATVPERQEDAMDFLAQSSCKLKLV